MTAADLLAQLEGVKGSAPNWTARCPAHEDRTPSLSITETSDRLLLRCHAGCSAEDVVAAVGRTMADLFLGDPVRPGGRWTREEADHALHLRGLRRETLEYFRVTADLGRQAWAFPLGRGRPAKFKAFELGNGGPKYWTERGASLGVYHLAPCRGQAEAWLIEGEPDVWIAHQAGVPAFSLTGGAGNINAACVEAIRRARIGVAHVVYDRDDPGREGARTVAEALAAAGQTVTVRELPADVGPGGDVTTLYNHLAADDAAFRAALAALPLRAVGGPETVRERNARIRDRALATLREVRQVASWPWGSLHRLLGGLVSEWVYVVAALVNNGKTMFGVNVLDHLWEHRIPTIYFGTEMPAEDLLNRWAAMRLAIDEQRVFDGELSDQEREAMESEITRLTARDEISFSTEIRVDLSRIVAELQWAFDARVGPPPRVVVVDHLQDIAQEREKLNELVKELKAIARERRVALVTMAQLNRNRDLGILDDYTPPSLARLKGTGTIGEVAHVVLGLFRPLRHGITGQQRRAVLHGELQPAEIAEPNGLAVAVLKHRYRGSAKGQFVRLTIQDGRIGSRAFAPAPPPPHAGDAWEPEPEEDGHAPF